MPVSGRDINIKVHGLTCVDVLPMDSYWQRDLNLGELDLFFIL